MLKYEYINLQFQVIYSATVLPQSNYKKQNQIQHYKHVHHITPICLDPPQVHLQGSVLHECICESDYTENQLYINVISN
jgi:hypothetical protein